MIPIKSYKIIHVIIDSAFYILVCIFLSTWGCLHGVMVKATECGIIVSKFRLQSRCNVHFRANTLILPAMG